MTATTAPDRFVSMPFLEADEVHVWRVALDQENPRDLAGLLSSAERATAARFMFTRDQDRYIVSHAALRSILARYLRAKPSMLCFTQGPQEKPRLAGVTGVSFNLAHSGDRALIGVAFGREVGIDVEQFRDADDLEALAASCFAGSELAAWRGLPTAARKSAFFLTWTRKEAYLKARGDGLARPLDSFDVTVGADSSPRLLRDAQDPAATAGWTFFDLDAGPGYAATVAIAGREARVLCWNFTSEEEEHGSRGAGGGGALCGRGEPGGAVLDLAGRQGPAEGMEDCGPDRLALGVLGPHQGDLDRHAPREPARLVAPQTFGSHP
jgi:4'-phosphopantetheinyl transferase